jgi:hypothetical protein
MGVSALAKPPQLSTAYSGVWVIILAVAIWFPSMAAPSQEPTRIPTPAPTPTIGPLQFQEVVQVEGATRDQLYDAALLWFPSVFKSGKDVLQVQNKDAGMLVGTAIEPYEPPMLNASSCTRGTLRYHITVEVKEGRYRYTIDGFTHEGGTPACKWGTGISWGLLTTNRLSPSMKGFTSGMEQEMWGDMKRKAAAIAVDLARTLKARLSTATTEKPW